MRLLIISKDGQGLGIATHLSSEGHAVAIDVSTNPNIGAGIVAVGGIDAPDIVLYDSHVFGREADEYRSTGSRALGASNWGNVIDSDAEYAQSLIRAMGWSTNSLTNGINLYITAWFNGANYISTYASLVYRRFMSGGRGPDIDFTGVIANFWQPTDRVREAFLNPLRDVLRRANHRGCFHIHAFVDGQKATVKSISASFSNPLSLLFYENSKLTTSELILKLFDESSTPVAPIEQWASGVLISVPPFPYTVHSEPTKLGGIMPGNLKHLWLVDVRKSGEDWTTTGTHGKIGYVTARGASVSEATRRVYRTISNLSIRDLQYRNDVGKGVHNMLSSLRQNGWLK